MNRKMIEHAIVKLREVQNNPDKRRRFDLEFWGNTTERHTPGQPEKFDCGFAGCFIGWAAHERWFEPFGYDLSLSENDGRAHRPHVKSLHNGTSLGDGVPGVARMFQITEVVLDEIVLPDHYAETPTPAVVANRLQYLLEVGEGEEFFEGTKEGQDQP